MEDGIFSYIIIIFAIIVVVVKNITKTNNSEDMDGAPDGAEDPQPEIIIMQQTEPQPQKPKIQKRQNINRHTQPSGNSQYISTAAEQRRKEETARDNITAKSAENTQETIHPDINNMDDVRRGIIWSEILNRKYQ